MSRAAAQALARLTLDAGTVIREERLRRRWTLEDLGRRAGLSKAHVQNLESGEAGSLEAYTRVMVALGLRPRLDAGDPRAPRPRPDEDLVHAAMGELEAARLRSHGLTVALDEPYQHFQFAGRADLVAWDLDRGALLHLENRTRFPNVQEALGSYGSKRAYMPRVLAERVGVGPRGWRSVTNAIVALWSAEVLRVVRRRSQTFAAACPDPAADFLDWWAGDRDRLPAGTPSTLVLIDPGSVRDRYRFATLEAALAARPRYSGYAEAATELEHAERDSRSRAGARLRPVESRSGTLRA